MTKNSPPVTIVIPTYNHARFLVRSIGSALSQTRPASEIIVIDDGSADEPSEVVRQFEQVRFVRQDNRGLAAARNRGLEAANGEKVVFLDADDALLPEALEAGLNCFDENPSAAFVYGAFRDVDSSGSTVRFTRMDSRCDLIRCNWIAMIGAAMFDRAKLLDAGGFDETLGMAEDWDLFLRLSRKHPFASHEQPVAIYYRQPDAMSAQVGKLKHWIEVVRRKERLRGLDELEQRAWREGRDVWDGYYPETGPRSLPRRTLRKVRRLVFGK